MEDRKGIYKQLVYNELRIGKICAPNENQLCSKQEINLKRLIFRLPQVAELTSSTFYSIWFYTF